MEQHRSQTNNRTTSTSLTQVSSKIQNKKNLKIDSNRLRMLSLKCCDQCRWSTSKSF